MQCNFSVEKKHHFTPFFLFFLFFPPKRYERHKIHEELGCFVFISLFHATLGHYRFSASPKIASEYNVSLRGVCLPQSQKVGDSH